MRFGLGRRTFRGSGVVTAYLDAQDVMWLETKLRRRFPDLGVWIALGGWDATSVTVSVRSYRGGMFAEFAVPCVNGFGEADVRETYRSVRGKIKEWSRTL